MDNKTLRMVQMVQLEIAKEFRRVCRELDLNYFLDSGTLLGAVRHKGFIPWDDDLDVGMLRDEYEIFLKEAPLLLDSKYFLQTWHTDKNYGLAFAKLRKRNTVYIEEASKKTGAENGIYIDIFPYDRYPVSDADRKWQGNRYWLYRRAIMVKSGYMPWLMNAVGTTLIIKKIGYFPIMIFASLFSKEKLISKYEAMCTKFNGTNSGFLYEQAGSSNYGEWVIPDRCFTEFTELCFENDFFSCPKDFDTYLKVTYGDYMTLPPEDKRFNRHRIMEIRFLDDQT